MPELALDLRSDLCFDPQYSQSPTLATMPETRSQLNHCKVTEVLLPLDQGYSYQALENTAWDLLMHQNVEDYDATMAWPASPKWV